MLLELLNRLTKFKRLLPNFHFPFPDSYSIPLH